MMTIEKKYPPNYEAIAEVFPLQGKKPIFAYGLTIFNPHGIQIGPELLAHEEVHGSRQGLNPAGWWERYLADDQFRLVEEIAAHAVEYLTICRLGEGDRRAGNQRAYRRRAFHHVASRLCDPMYAYKPRLPYDRAREYLKIALKEAERKPQKATITAPVNPNVNVQEKRAADMMAGAAGFEPAIQVLET